MRIRRVADARIAVEVAVAEAHLRALRRVRPDGARAVVLLVIIVPGDADRLGETAEAQVPGPRVARELECLEPRMPEATRALGALGRVGIRAP